MATATSTSSRTQRTIRLLAYMAILAAALALIGAATVTATDWLISNADPSNVSTATLDRRGKIGQTFNAANAMFSGLALLAVATTVLLQRRELRMQREELTLMRKYSRKSEHEARRAAEAAMRSNHNALLSLAIENEHLGEVWPPYSIMKSQTHEERSQFLYCNLVLSHLWVTMMTENCADDEIRMMLRYILRSPIIQEFWRTTRQDRLAMSTGDAERKIDRLMDDEYGRLSSGSTQSAA